MRAMLALVLSLRPTTRQCFAAIVPLVLLLGGPVGCSSVVDRVPAAAPTPIAVARVPRAELLQRQEHLDVLAREIQDLVDPLEGPVAKPLPSGDDRYGEVRIDSERDVVELWWAGPLPPEARAALRRHPDITVEVHRARYSNNELQAAGRRVADALRAGLLGTDVTCDVIVHDVPSGRIGVTVLDPHDRWTVGRLHQRLDPLTPVPMDVVRQRSTSFHFVRGAP